MCELAELAGTVRERSGEETWARLEPLVAGYGITRVAELTGLDVIGVPVWTAIRPGAVTLSASQGKGATWQLAAISAVMEAIELWHVEQPLPVAWHGSARTVGAPYPLSALPQRIDDDRLDRVTLDWTAGTGLVTGGRVPVPVGAVERRPPDVWRPQVFRATSTGLACGTSRLEALLHALYEVIERHALHIDEQRRGELRTWIDPGTVDEPYVRSLIERVQTAGAVLDLAVVSSPYGMPVCLAYLWSEDFPLWFAGGGCHHDPHVALARAITEAVQSRLTCIAGTRDDLPSEEPVHQAAPAARPAAKSGLQRWEPVVGGGRAGGLAAQVDATAALVQAVTGYEPLVVDLTQPGSVVAAVKVVAPGATARTRKDIPR
ncbi:YcaO-like family protein [Streptomyces anandii]|uniref:YcaO-like family protein n=1 Tax=Streptomyces anandii TaxID=285454 RepID=UPI00378937D7